MDVSRHIFSIFIMEKILPELTNKLLVMKGSGLLGAITGDKFIKLLQCLDWGYRAGLKTTLLFSIFLFKCILLFYLTICISGRILREPMELDEEDFLGKYFCPFFLVFFYLFILDTDCDDQNVDQYQSRNLYADLLPHSEFIPEEADKWWAWIKMNLPRCVEAMEIRPGLLQVDRYLRVYISLHRNRFSTNECS